jgi:hypothetical protein
MHLDGIPLPLLQVPPKVQSDFGAAPIAQARVAARLDTFYLALPLPPLGQVQREWELRLVDRHAIVHADRKCPLKPAVRPPPLLPFSHQPPAQSRQQFDPGM